MSKLETDFAFQLDALGVDYEREYPFIEGRKFRADFAILPYRLLIEIQGGTWVANTGHSSGRGLTRDYEKSNLANVNGWCYLQFTGADVETGAAINQVYEYINRKERELR